MGKKIKKLVKSSFIIVYFLVGITAVSILWTLLKSSVSTELRWLFWVVFIGGIWLVVWLVARKQGKSFSDIWNEEESFSD